MSDTQDIKDKLDIVELIGEYIQLKPAGTNHKGRCPFHNEKTPSFMVSRERQTFKCFGCGKGGDVFTFIQEIEGMEFVEALKMLANKAGVTLTRQVNEVSGNQKNRVKDVLLNAARFYHNVLTQLPAAGGAKAYLKNRGITDQTIESWQIGFVPDQWDLLTKYLLKKGHSIDDLIAAGLTIKRDNANVQTGKGFYDRFRGRIMFPIRNVHGTVVGFTGRVLVETERSGGKYVNTPQTIVYDKSRVVFGLDKAKQSIRKQDLVVMVEGQMDVITAHQAGFDNVVATSGTALTDMQIKLLKRYTTNMNMAFDADAAGQAAAKRGIDIALAVGMRVKVIQIPEGKGEDPDECIQKHPEVWQTAVEQATEVMQWYLDGACKDKNLTNPRDKQTIVDTVLPEIARIPYAVERDHWMQELALRLKVDIAILREDASRLASAIKQRPAPKKKEQAKETANPQEKTRLNELIERFLALLLTYPKELSATLETFNKEYLSTSPLLPLYESIVSEYTSVGSIDIGNFCDKHKEREPQVKDLQMRAAWEFSQLNQEKASTEMQTLTASIKEEWQRERRQEIQKALQAAEAAEDTQKIAALLATFQSL